MLFSIGHQFFKSYSICFLWGALVFSFLKLFLSFC